MSEMDLVDRIRSSPRRITFEDYRGARRSIRADPLAPFTGAEPTIAFGAEGGLVVLDAVLARWVAARLVEFADAGTLDDECEPPPG